MLKRLLVLAASLLFVGAGCGKPATPAAEAPSRSQEKIVAEKTSDDGVVTVKVPEGALPAGVTPERITFKKNVVKLPAKLGGGTITVYSLGPDGVTFAKPLRLTFVPPSVNGRVPMLFHDDRGEFKPLDDMTVGVDPETMLPTYEGTVTHFSDFQLAGWLPVTAYVTTRGSHLIGESFPANLRLEAGYAKADQGTYLMKPGGVDKDGFTVFDANDYYVMKVHGPVVVRGGKVYPNFAVLTPPQIEGLPERKEYALPSSGTRTVDSIDLSFVCAKYAPDFFLRYAGIAEMTVDYVHVVNGQEQPGNKDSKFTYGMQTFVRLGQDVNSGSCLYPLSKTTGIQLTQTIDLGVLEIGGHYYPDFQFHAARPDKCDDSHWHLDGVQSAVAIDLTVTPDPDQHGCGFGKVRDVPRKTLKIPQQDWWEFGDARSKAP